MGFAYPGSDLSKLLTRWVNVDLSHLLDNIDSIKVSDSITYVREKRGRNVSSATFECSECGRMAMVADPNYCPWCGCKLS